MMSEEFFVGKQRREIEDSILARYARIRFEQPLHAYLEEADFWDFVFAWFELARYYELSEDPNVGANMLELFAVCGQRCREAAQDRRLTERRRDKAADALYQLSYYVNSILIEARRNAIERESQVGEIKWKPARDDDSSHRFN